jgi:urea transport system permease protein
LCAPSPPPPTEPRLKVEMDVLTTPFLTGTATGAILLLAALGLSLTFGQMGVINMANGEFLMAGAYAAYVTQQVISSTGLSIVVAVPVAFCVAGLLGLLLEMSIIQWMYKRPLDTLLATVGVALVLQQAAKDLFGAQGDPVKAPGWLGGHISVFGYDWPHRQAFTIILALASFAALNAALKYTSFGRRIRATVQNRELAETMGVSTRRVDRMTFVLGSGLAGVGGVAIAMISGTNPTLGTTYIIPAFLVVVAGGVGQLKGTLFAAWAVGVVTAYLTDWTSGSMAQVITFALVVVFLQIRPQGLFTVRTRSLA